MAKNVSYRGSAFLLSLIILVSVIAGLAFYRFQEKRIRHTVEDQFNSIAKLKAMQIADWRKDRLDEALGIIESPFFTAPAERLVNKPMPADAADMMERFQSLKKRFGYSQILLTRPDGTVCLRMIPANNALPADMISKLQEAIAAQKPLLTPLHLSSRDNIPHLDVVVPLYSRPESSQTLYGSLMLRLDASTSLYPLVEQWPLPSKTAEVLLCRRNGDSVQFVSRLRYKSGAEVKFKVSLTDTEVPAVQAVLGRTGTMLGKDYQGVPVLAALQPVPEAPWFIVAKEEQHEAFAEWHSVSRLLIGLYIVLLAAIAALAAFLWQQQQKESLKELFQSRDALMRSENRFQALFSSMSEGMALHELVFDSSGNPVNYRLIDINPSYRRHTGIADADVVGRLGTEVYGTEVPPYFEQFSGVALSGKPDVLETYFPPLKKHFRISIFCPGPNQFATVFSDITLEKETEARIAEERERLAVTLRSIGDGVITTDIHGKVVLINPVAEKLTGWKIKEAAGRPLPEVFNIVNEFTRKPCENPVDKVLQSGIVVELANHTMLISRDGREYIIADSGAPIRDMQSRVIGVVLVFHDTTEKQRMLENLQRSQKLESLGTLAAGIAHDFNNLLAGIFGYTEVALTAVEKEDTGRAANSLHKVLGVFERARGLTHQLLTFSKGGEPIKRAQRLEPLLRRSTEFALSGSNVAPVFTIDDNLWPCDVDETQMEQVMDNLIINAKQAMPSGGEVSIEARNIRLEPNAHALLAEGGEFVRVTVTDKGNGIPKELMPRIFDPFFTTKTQGQGLGLATVHSIIQRHSGCIEAVSVPGKGSSFIFYLPAYAGPAPREESVQAVVENRKGLVLVMDDEDFIRDITSEKLKSAGYDVVCAENGRMAVSLFENALRSGKPFAAVILDLTVPGGMGGREAVQEIRRMGATVPVIAASGYSSDPVMTEPASYGFTASLRKPFREAELLGLLGSLVVNS